jgi:hypothetical protein
MLVGPDDVFVEREGRIERVGDGLFEGEEAVHQLIGWEIERCEKAPVAVSAPGAGP